MTDRLSSSLKLHLIPFILSFVFINTAHAETLKDLLAPPKKLKPALQRYTSQAPPPNTYAHRTFRANIPFNRKNISFIHQSRRWQNALKKLGKFFQQKGVIALYLVHGTFVGNDPFGFAFLLQSLFPHIDKKLIQAIHKMSLKQNEFLYKDLGHYSKHYVRLLRHAFPDSLKIKRFIWSSENHHVARLKGAIRLVKRLSKDLCSKIPHQQPSQKPIILLLGHSHAGQIFALLSHFLANSAYTEPLLRVLMPYGEQRFRFRKKLRCLRHFLFDVTTFGTPPRYTWVLSSHFRLLNIINHRGHPYLGAPPFGICWRGECSGLLTTKNGDYIQQWGISGTDALLASNPADQKANEKLDELLGKGSDLVRWAKWVKLRMRVPHFGFTYLVDYRDDSKIFPNGFKTLFGHGIYTRYDTMLFNLQLIKGFFFKKRGVRRR